MVYIDRQRLEKPHCLPRLPLSPLRTHQGEPKTPAQNEMSSISQSARLQPHYKRPPSYPY